MKRISHKYFFKCCNRLYLLMGFVFLGTGCKQGAETLFKKIDADASNIQFENHLEETEQLNVMQYEYLYNGGGVAAGDINNDGLADLYFTGNTVPNKLYLNKSKMVFEDITVPAGVAGKDAWKTGVNMADVNGDGWLDIYVCYSGPGNEADRANQLFINKGIKNGTPQFEEKAAEYGLDAPGTYSTQSAFFDYDNDGDIDMFLLNHSKTFFSPFFNTSKLRSTRHQFYGNRLYRNDNGKFTDVSVQAGIHGSGMNFGLGIAVSDINGDGFADIYVSNDYDEQDFLYLNKKDGTFADITATSFSHMSKFSMGNDIADINNDHLPDIITLDMLPEDNKRQKLLKGPDDYDRYQLSVDSGYLRQQMRNMLQLNRGNDNNGLPVFSEIAQVAGISNTDWSWSALTADYDNDGYKDLFISNGYLRDFTNQDFTKFTVAEAMAKARSEGMELLGEQGKQQNAQVIYDLVKKMPATKVADYMYRNKGNTTFENVTASWGLSELNITTGAVYADLDNDGDLDLITNYTNQKAGIYQNNTEAFTGNHFLKIKLKGTGKNSLAIGAKVYVETDSCSQFYEQFPVRGYQSSVEPVINAGIGKNNLVKQVKVKWPDGKVSLLSNIAKNSSIIIDQSTAVPDSTVVTASQGSLMFKDITSQAGISGIFTENVYVDFKVERLSLAQLSRQGPKMSKADVNGDGLEDFFIGGPAGSSGILYLMKPEGAFVKAPSQPWQLDKSSEDIGSVFFDADGDGDKDLYVVSGGSEFVQGSPELQDRLYLNNGKGDFTKAPDSTIPAETSSGACVAAADYDKDGDLDLFVGGRVKGGSYPMSAPGGILKNETNRTTGNVKFTLATKEVNETLRQPGMVTDAVWADVNNDTWPDLILAGEWMPITLYVNDKGKLTDVTAAADLSKTNGLWNKIVAADIDGDGDTDFVAGNMGLNSQFTASPEQPLQMYAGNFSGNGNTIPIVCNYVQGKSYPIATLDEITDAIPALKKKFLKYEAYADAGIKDIFSPEILQSSTVLNTYTLQTVYIENKGNNKFVVRPLPLEAQYSVVQGIIINDFTKDGKPDLLIAGNFFPYRVQYGPCDASIGLLLQGDGRGNFNPINRNKSGVLIQGDVRDMIILQGKSQSFIISSKNNQPVQVVATQH